MGAAFDEYVSKIGPSLSRSRPDFDRMAAVADRDLTEARRAVRSVQAEFDDARARLAKANVAFGKSQTPAAQSALEFAQDFMRSQAQALDRARAAESGALALVQQVRDAQKQSRGSSGKLLGGLANAFWDAHGAGHQDDHDRAYDRSPHLSRWKRAAGTVAEHHGHGVLFHSLFGDDSRETQRRVDELRKRKPFGSEFDPHVKNGIREAARRAQGREKAAAQAARDQARQERSSQREREAAMRRAEQEARRAAARAEAERNRQDREAKKAQERAEREEERTRQQAERKAERERIQAEKQAERDRKAAERQAERDRKAALRSGLDPSQSLLVPDQAVGGLGPGPASPIPGAPSIAGVAAGRRPPPAGAGSMRAIQSLTQHLQEQAESEAKRHRELLEAIEWGMAGLRQPAAAPPPPAPPSPPDEPPEATEPEPKQARRSSAGVAKRVAAKASGNSADSLAKRAATQQRDAKGHFIKASAAAPVGSLQAPETEAPSESGHSESERMGQWLTSKVLEAAKPSSAEKARQASRGDRSGARANPRKAAEDRVKRAATQPRDAKGHFIKASAVAPAPAAQPKAEDAPAPPPAVSPHTPTALSPGPSALVPLVTDSHGKDLSGQNTVAVAVHGMHQLLEELRHFRADWTKAREEDLAWREEQADLAAKRHDEQVAAVSAQRGRDHVQQASAHDGSGAGGTGHGGGQGGGFLEKAAGVAEEAIAGAGGVGVASRAKGALRSVGRKVATGARGVAGLLGRAGSAIARAAATAATGVIAAESAAAAATGVGAVAGAIALGNSVDPAEAERHIQQLSRERRSDPMQGPPQDGLDVEGRPVPATRPQPSSPLSPTAAPPAGSPPSGSPPSPPSPPSSSQPPSPPSPPPAVRGSGNGSHGWLSRIFGSPAQAAPSSGTGSQPSGDGGMSLGRASYERQLAEMAGRRQPNGQPYPSLTPWSQLPGSVRQSMDAGEGQVGAFHQAQAARPFGQSGLEGELHTSRSGANPVPVTGGGGGSSGAPIGGPTFVEKSKGVMSRLQADFGLTREQAAGIVGNLGHESGGFRHMQEINPVGGGRGGLGWAQWTGPRRVQFEQWSAQHGLDPSSDEANYGFLKHELETTQKGSLDAVRGTSDVRSATRAFEGSFERAGVKAYESRERFAQQALAASSDTPPGQPGHGQPGQAQQAQAAAPDGPKVAAQAAAAAPVPAVQDVQDKRDSAAHEAAQADGGGGLGPSMPVAMGPIGGGGGGGGGGGMSGGAVNSSPVRSDELSALVMCLNAGFFA